MQVSTLDSWFNSYLFSGWFDKKKKKNAIKSTKYLFINHEINEMAS